MEKIKALKKLVICILIFLIIVGGFVCVMDPFYVYHAPLGGQETVLYDRDYQMPGTIRNFKYDTVILGSSVAENFDSEYVDEYYNANTIKIIRASGSVADLLYYMNAAHDENKIKQVFWCLDIFALTSSTQTTFQNNEELNYLHTKSPLDDITYLYNKDILMEEIPLSLAYSVMDINTGGQAYYWAADKDFSAAGAMRAYSKSEGITTDVDYSAEEELLQENIALVLREIEEHPDTEYIIMFPPYSMMWWDCGYVNGIGDLYLEVLEETLPVLCTLDNAKVYFFQDERDIVCNLDNYMDMIHYSPDINQYMLECVVKEERRVTSDNVEEVLGNMKNTYQYIINEGIYIYYPKEE